MNTHPCLSVELQLCFVELLQLCTMKMHYGINRCSVPMNTHLCLSVELQLCFVELLPLCTFCVSLLLSSLLLLSRRLCSQDAQGCLEHSSTLVSDSCTL